MGKKLASILPILMATSMSGMSTKWENNFTSPKPRSTYTVKQKQKRKSKNKQQLKSRKRNRK